MWSRRATARPHRRTCGDDTSGRERSTSWDLKAKTKRARMDSLHHPRECPRPDEATIDTSCRCYLRGPDGVRRLLPSGTWDAEKYSALVIPNEVRDDNVSSS